MTDKPTGVFSSVTPRQVASQYDNLFKQIITAGWAVQSDGDVESSWGYFSLIEIPSHEGEFTELMDALELDDEDENLLRALPRGWYISIESSDGFIYVYEVTSGEIHAKALFSIRADHFSEWSEQREHGD